MDGINEAFAMLMPRNEEDIKASDRFIEKFLQAQQVEPEWDKVLIYREPDDEQKKMYILDDIIQAIMNRYDDVLCESDALDKWGEFKHEIGL